MDLEQSITRAVGAHPSVRDVRLTGSRASGSPTPLSDWDFEVETDDFATVKAALPELVAPVRPLGAQWDPNGERPTYMLMLRGPAKVDLIFPAQHQKQGDPRHTVSNETLPAIDHHFWDWILWLAAKQLAGRRPLVAKELGRMYDQLLEPLGVDRVPPGIPAAIAAYRRGRSDTAARLGIDLDTTLDRAVAPAIERHLGEVP